MTHVNVCHESAESKHVFNCLHICIALLNELQFITLAYIVQKGDEYENSDLSSEQSLHELTDSEWEDLVIM